LTDAIAVGVRILALPIKFSNVLYYRISGRYIFSGDLFILRQMLYFFPEADLAEQREKITRRLPHQLALPVLAFMYLVPKLGLNMPRNDLWEPGISEDEFRKKADAYVQKLRQERIGKSPHESLPLPIVVTPGEVADLKLTVTGKLSFFAQSDTHDFNIGVTRKNRLHSALWESGLAKVYG
jgi:hypothetical protein